MKGTKVDKSQYESDFGFTNKVLRLFWNICYYLFFRPFWPRSLNKWRVFILKCFGADIKWSSMVYPSVKIWAPWNLEMGIFATLGPQVDCYNQGRITIGSHTTVSQKSYLCASSHVISDPKFPLVLRPILIEPQVWVAAGAFIGPGVHIKEGAVIAATSSVFKDVEPWTVVGGNPAKFINERKIES